MDDSRKKISYWKWERERKREREREKKREIGERDR
jgi:hypothetical protein